MEDLVVAQRVGEFEGPLRTLLDLGLIRADGFEQQLRSKLKNRAIVAAINRMRDTIRFGLVEEQNVVRVGHELEPRNPLQKHTRARENDMMRARMFLRAVIPAFR